MADHTEIAVLTRNSPPLTFSMSVMSLLFLSVFFFLHAALRANWSLAAHMWWAPWRQAVTLNQEIKHHSCPRSNSDLQIMTPTVVSSPAPLSRSLRYPAPPTSLLAFSHLPFPLHTSCWCPAAASSLVSVHLIRMTLDHPPQPHQANSGCE